MASLLDSLKRHTIVVADTGDIRSIRQYGPRDATTNPSLITAAAAMPEYADIVDSALLRAKREAGAGANDEAVASLAIERLAVELGMRILAIVPGRVSTEIDARLSFDTARTIEKGRKVIHMYEEEGASRERVLVKIASTWEGIRAAEVLEREGIHCNLTLLFGLHQAAACADAGVTLISPFVGRILDYYVKATGRSSYPPAEDPGVVSVTRIYEYFKRHGYKTQIMGASFRNAGEILELAGCDLLTVSPKLLGELASKPGEVERKLDPERAAKADIAKLDLDEAAFRRMHAADPMATDKLAEGIDGFSKALVALEKQLVERLATTGGGHRDAAKDLFGVFDLDGDGAITREEWAGKASVFDALDEDGDGRISPTELAAGLGAAYRLQS